MRRLVPLLWIAACAPPPDPRDAWLLDALYDDNRIWLTRDHALLAGKLERMASDPYDYLRGTAGPWFQDLSRPSGDRPVTALLQDAEATDVILVGDPHPENLSLVPVGDDLAPTALALTWVDLDAAGFGPWTLDVRRAALGVLAAFEGRPGCAEACRSALLRGLVDGYLGGLVGEPHASAILDELRAEAWEEGAARQRLVRDSADGRLVVGQPPDDTLVPAATDEAVELEVAARAWRETAAPAGLRLLDAARRLGTGVASMPALRFQILVDRGIDGPADNSMVQLREVVDPPTLSGAVAPRSWDDAADRLEAIADAVWTPGADPLRAAFAAGGRAWKVLGYTSFHQGIEHLDLAAGWDEGRWQLRDAVGLAGAIGEALAQVHTRGSGDVVRAGLGPDGGALLRDDVLRAAESDRLRWLDDYERFVRLLEARGPLLGFDAVDAP